MTETTDIKALRDSAECMANLLDNLAGYEPSDIDTDAVELRFEDERGCDTGCDISIVDTAQQSADIIRALLDQLEAERQRADEFEHKFRNELGHRLIQEVKTEAIDEANGRAHKAEAELAALRGTQEPVEYQFQHVHAGGAWLRVSKEECEIYKANGWNVRALFTHPAKPVELPPRKSAKDYVDDEFTNADLAAIYNVARLECKVRIKDAGIVVKDGE